MRHITVKGTNFERIAQELAGVQKRCTARTVTSAQVLHVSEQIVEYYAGKTGSKKALEGCKFFVDMNNQDFPNAYKYTPESTLLSLEYSHGSMKLVAIVRGRTFPEKTRVKAMLTDEAKAAIVEKAASCNEWDLERGY